MSHGHGPQLGFWVVAPSFIAVGYFQLQIKNAERNTVVHCRHTRTHTHTNGLQNVPWHVCTVSVSSQTDESEGNGSPRPFCDLQLRWRKALTGKVIRLSIIKLDTLSSPEAL